MRTFSPTKGVVRGDWISSGRSGIDAVKRMMSSITSSGRGVVDVDDIVRTGYGAGGGREIALASSSSGCDDKAYSSSSLRTGLYVGGVWLNEFDEMKSSQAWKVVRA